MAAKKKTSTKKKLTLDKETVKKLTDKDLEGVAGGRKPAGGGHGTASYQTCNMKCNSDKSACGC
jgi:hypothetical protein